MGPKTALGILSALPPPDLASAVADKDLGRLTSISGIGKKTAERLILELKEKLPRVAELRAPANTERRGDDSGRLLGALTNMGYRQPEAERAVAALGDPLSAPIITERQLRPLLNRPADEQWQAVIAMTTKSKAKISESRLWLRCDAMKYVTNCLARLYPI